MRIAFLAIFNLALLVQVSAQSGEELFKATCIACHTINGGKLIGPDLSGVYNKQPEDWLIRFIRSSQTVIKSGDPDAVAIFNQFSKIPMPDNNLSDAQIISIIDYIRQADVSYAEAAGRGKAAGDTLSDSTLVRTDSAATAPGDTIRVTSEVFDQGRAFFYGRIPFTNGATPCFSCHYINDVSFLGGGKLALDLTGAYTKLSPAGITAILKNPPFPAMKAALPGQLTEQEISALNVLLKGVSERIPYSASKRGGMSFFLLGLLCSIFLLVMTVLLYDNRMIPDKTPLAK